MLNFRKMVLPALLAASILVPSAVYASSVNDTQPATTTKIQAHKGNHKNHENFNKELKDVEKYVPGAEEQVKQVMTERRDLWKQLKELKLKKLGVDTSFMNDYRKIAHDTHEKVKNGQMTEEDAKKYLDEQKKKFETDHAAELAKLKQVKEEYAEAHEDEIKSTKKSMKQDMKKTKEAQKALREAVKSGDAAKVKDAYNNYLNALKESNQLLKSELSKLSS